MRAVGVWPLAVLGACYRPTVPAGAPCETSADCPRDQACVALICGGTSEDVDAAIDAVVAIDAPVDAVGPNTIVIGTKPGELRDTELWSEQPKTNFGDQNHFSVDDTELGLVRFDLSGVPANRALLAASLVLATADQADEAGGTVLVHRLREAWTESEATFIDRTAVAAWLAPGASPPSRDAMPVAELAPSAIERAFTVALPLTLVRAWLADPDENHGLAIVRGTSTQHVHFSTRETGAWSKLVLELAP